MSYVPAYYIGAPHTPGHAITISPNTPVYSSYSGDLIGYGPIKWNTANDAPVHHEKHGQSYHVVEMDSNGNYMAHGISFHKYFF